MDVNSPRQLALLVSRQTFRLLLTFCFFLSSVDAQARDRAMNSSPWLHTYFLKSDSFLSPPLKSFTKGAKCESEKKKQQQQINFEEKCISLCTYFALQETVNDNLLVEHHIFPILPFLHTLPPIPHTYLPPPSSTTLITIVTCLFLAFAYSRLERAPYK